MTYKELPILGLPILSTWGNLPSPALVAPYIQRYAVSDYVNGPTVVYSNGTNWLSDSYKIQNYKLEAVPFTSNSNTEVIAKSFKVLGGFLSIGDYVQFNIGISKDNGSNAQSVTLRIGTSGNISDTLIATSPSTISAASTAQVVAVFGGTVVSSTQMKINNVSAGSGLDSSSYIVTIPNISGDIYFNAGMFNVTNTSTIFSVTTYLFTVAK